MASSSGGGGVLEINKESGARETDLVYGETEGSEFQGHGQT